MGFEKFQEQRAPVALLIRTDAARALSANEMVAGTGSRKIECLDRRNLLSQRVRIRRCR